MCYHHHDIAFRVYPANKGGSQPIKKRIFSAFLSAALLLSLTPWAALAAENPATQVEEQELQTSFQSPPQDPDIYSDPQPSIQVPETPEETPENPETPEVPKIAPEVVPEVQTAPVAVQAAETHENHDACAAGVCNVDNHSSRHVTTEWTPVSSLSEIRGNGFYYLTQDVIQSGKWNVPASSNPGVILCLNGHKITLEKGGTYSNSGISVSSTNFILTDCPDKNGQVIQTTNDNAVSVGYWGDFYMFGGTITHADDVTGSGVYIIGSDAQNNSFKMYGGCITKNTAKNGGGIYVSNSYSRTSSVTIRSGSITANNATDNGGGVYLDGNVYFSMTGGSITNNTATQNGDGV